ncbi:MAG: Conserved TM helix repeat-containing protein [Parcubacteria group bacterium GW2011_GWC1_41_7]|nr:MAG: Conserved TM helix repeat-containing protein [Parcubacteria group bacterium GW2011_GWC1_41_7]
MNTAGIVASIIGNFLTGFALYFPKFLAGLLLLLVGVFIANFVWSVIIGFFKLLNFEKWSKESRLTFDVNVWPKLIGELFRWSVLILFLVSAVETWGMRKVGDVLNQLLLYLPNVFVAVIMGLVGVVVANLVYDLVRHSAKSLGAVSSGSLASLARYAILVFTGLVVLHQLGVAADLIRILFTGVIVMIALAGGLAFGLGGQDAARDIIAGIRREMKD